MKRHDFNDVYLENAMIISTDNIIYKGKLSYMRIDRKTVPENLNCYEIRHDDGSRGDACSVEKSVLVNFYGTFITSDIIDKDINIRRLIVL